MYSRQRGRGLPVITTGPNDVKERLSVGLVTLIAGRAGCQVTEYPVDRNSRDISISPVDGLKINIDAQLKSTVNLIQTGPVMKFDLDRKNYDELRATEVGSAQILIVVDLHQARQRWVRQSSRHLVFDKCAYWANLYDAPATANANKIRINIPKDQVLTPSALEELFERRYQRLQAGEGGL